MKRVDIDSLTECAEDLSLHDFKRARKTFTNALFKVVPNIWKKTSVDFIFLAISEVLKKELRFQSSQPTLQDIDEIYSYIEFLLKSLDIPNFTILDDDFYIDGELLSKVNVSYSIRTDPKIEEVMQPLRFPICLDIHLKRKGKSPLRFSIIREVHSPTILLWSNDTSATIHGSFDKIDIDKELLDDWIANSTYGMRNRRKMLCC